jgi:cell division septum initiation protein DivIVA
MDILHLVDRLETLLSKGWHIPFTSNVVVQEDAFLDLIDQMRISIPDEVKQARRLGAERERLIAQAQQEADRIVATAHEQISSLITDQEVVKQAEQKAQAVIGQANQSAEKIRADADTYVVEVLGNLEEELLQAITTVRNGIHKLERPASRGGAASRVTEGNPAEPEGA